MVSSGEALSVMILEAKKRVIRLNQILVLMMKKKMKMMMITLFLRIFEVFGDSNRTTLAQEPKATVFFGDGEEASHDLCYGCCFSCCV